MCGGRSSILHYGPLIETNYLYAPTPNGQRTECVAEQKQPPPNSVGSPLVDTQNIYEYCQSCWPLGERMFFFKGDMSDLLISYLLNLLI